MAVANRIEWERYRNLADEAWKASAKRGKCKKVCEVCTDEAKKEGKNAPLFPPNYEGNCPRCGGTMRICLPC